MDAGYVGWRHTVALTAILIIVRNEVQARFARVAVRVVCHGDSLFSTSQRSSAAFPIDAGHFDQLRSCRAEAVVAQWRQFRAACYH